MQALRAGREAAGQLAAADLVRDLGGPFARTSILRRTVRHLFYTPVGRRGLEPRLAEGQAALAALMYAGARALEEAPEEADCRFQVLYGAARDLRIFWFSPLASWDPERLQGRRARTPAGHAWLAWARREAGTARRAAVHDDPDLRTREALSWRRALEPGQGPGSDFRWLESLENLGDLLEDERDREGLVRLWRVHGRQVRARPSLRGGKLALRFLRAVLAGESAPPAEVAAALAYLEGDDPAFSGRGLGGFSGAEVERLRGLARAGPPPGAPRPGAARPGAPPAPR